MTGSYAGPLHYQGTVILLLCKQFKGFCFWLSIDYFTVCWPCRHRHTYTGVFPLFRRSLYKVVSWDRRPVSRKAGMPRIMIHPVGEIRTPSLPVSSQSFNLRSSKTTAGRSAIELQRDILDTYWRLVFIYYT